MKNFDKKDTYTSWKKNIFISTYKYLYLIQKN